MAKLKPITPAVVTVAAKQAALGLGTLASLNETTVNEIADAAVDTDQIADGSVTESKIDTGAVTAGKLGTSAVTTLKIADLNVTTGKLAAGAVTNAKQAPMAAFTLKGNAVGEESEPQDLTHSGIPDVMDAIGGMDDTMKLVAFDRNSGALITISITDLRSHLGL